MEFDGSGDLVSGMEQWSGAGGKNYQYNSNPRPAGAGGYAAWTICRSEIQQQAIPDNHDEEKSATATRRNPWACRFVRGDVHQHHGADSPDMAGKAGDFR